MVINLSILFLDLLVSVASIHDFDVSSCHSHTVMSFAVCHRLEGKAPAEVEQHCADAGASCSKDGLRAVLAVITNVLQAMQ